MPNVKLTKRLIDSINKYRDQAKKVFLWDTALTGFGVVLFPTGKTSWVVNHRGPDGRIKRITIADLTRMDLDTAKERAKTYLDEIDKGEHTRQAKEAAERNKVPTVREAADQYLAVKTMKEYSRKQYKHNLEFYCGSLFERSITAASEPEIIALAAEIQRKAKERTGGKRDGKAAAFKALAMLRAVLTFASATYRYADGSRMLVCSPTRILTETRCLGRKNPPRRDFVSVEELPYFYRFLQDCDTTAKNYFLFLVLTGFRRNEARRLRWSGVNLLSRRITLTPAETKTNTGRTIPITAELEMIIRQQAEFKTPVSEFVFQGSGRLSSISESHINKVFSKLKEALQRPDLKVHGLRRTYITHVSKPEIMNEQAVKLLVGHSLDITGRYNQMSFDDLKEPAQRATTHLMNLLTKDISEPERAIL